MSSEPDHSPATALRASTWSATLRRITERITNWRNWKLPVKLGAVVLVPVIFALALGTLQIQGQVAKSDEYAELDRLVGAMSAVRSSVADLQQERSLTAEFLARGPVPEPELRDRFAAADRNLDATRRLLESAPNTAAVRSAREEADRWLSDLTALRTQVLNGRMDAGAATNTYTDIIGALLSLDRTLTTQMSSAELVSTATTAHELAKIGEEMQLQQALLVTGLTRGTFTSDDLARLAASESRRASAVMEFRAAATPGQRAEYDRLYLNPQVPARESAVQLAMDAHSSGRDKTSLPLAPSTWKDQSRAALSAVGSLQSRLDHQLHRTAFALQDSASNLAGTESVVLLSALLVAGAVVVVVARQLLGSLDVLRRTALDTAENQLPRAVADIRAGHRPRDPVTRVPVDTADEVGQVARAFDAVHTQAVGLAAEQADLRRSYRDSFVNVSRRSQGLLERQLRLFEQLERDEEDPDQLATLFQLDHLATRMRRNNENLMVLSGTDLARRFTQPASAADLVRAAISEIEHYPRVVVQPLPDAHVVGYAAGDVVRLLAELLDNAANFSAPQTQVVVSGHRRGDGSLVLDIVDRGIGMNDDELDAVNRQLAEGGEVEPSTSRRMGLFVVGRLATRHGIDVEFRRGPEATGVNAAVYFGPELLLEPAATPTVQTNGAHHHDTLVDEFDWAAAEQDAAAQQPVRNGFHLLHPSPNGHAAAADGPGPASHATPPRRTNGSAPSPPPDGLAPAWFQTMSQGCSDQGVQWPGRPAEGESKGTFLSHVEERFPCSQPDDKDWTFASDTDKQRAEEVAAAEPNDYTTAGLPVRIPRAHLVAGSINTDEEPKRPRDPNVARSRLSSFQEGLRRGRHRRQAAPQPPQGTPTSEADGGASDLASTGLPRRVPRTESAPSSTSDFVTAPPRDADQMRGRLASFQRGVREGKHTLREPGARHTNTGENPNQ
ncbi:sensor histidine kinase [Saccharopolyspora rosea]|uniref:sensor histidine kinase n=1 Tax=Saccharopolyspora rosea TaxID=524884 RepID=UPI0021D88EB9|nr:nitrate- and nitrite sensing domain-containing protein [Saccharopolyspora rosea]